MDFTLIILTMRESYIEELRDSTYMTDRKCMDVMSF
jgi:hypothetical protein